MINPNQMMMMNTNPNAMMMNANPNAMIESIKSLVITMLMVKGTTGGDNASSSIINTILLMIAISFIDTIVNYIKSLIAYISQYISNYISSKTKEIPLINNKFTASKKTSITIKIEPASKNPTSDAIIDLLTNLPQTKINFASRRDLCY